MGTPLHLAEPYASALREAVAYLNERYNPIGVVTSGTIIRGTAQAASDLDIVAIHEKPWRQRSQRFFNGVPADMFVNPEYRIRDGMRSDAAAGRPVMAHMLATGVVLHDPTGIMADLRVEAKATLKAGPRVSAASMTFRRYAIATAFEDAVDIREIDEGRAHSLLTEALVEAVKWHFLDLGKWLPRSKALLTDLDALDPDLGREVRMALRPGPLHERMGIATSVMERTVGVTGFFEWDSEPETIPPTG